MESTANAEISQELPRDWQALCHPLSSFSSRTSPLKDVTSEQAPRYISYIPSQSYSRPLDFQQRQSITCRSALEGSAPAKQPHWYAEFQRKRFLRKQINRLAEVTKDLTLCESPANVNEIQRQVRSKSRESRERNFLDTEMEWHAFGCGESMDDVDEERGRLKRKVPIVGRKATTEADVYCMAVGHMVVDSSMSVARHTASRPIKPLRTTRKLGTTLATIAEGPELVEHLEPDAVGRCSSRLTSLQI